MSIAISCHFSDFPEMRAHEEGKSTEDEVAWNSELNNVADISDSHTAII